MKQLIVAGMPRAGTTFLYHNLQLHPDFFLPFRKEVNYFNVNFDRGPDWYQSLYVEAGAMQTQVDISPLCFACPGSEERIKAYNEDAAIVIVVRDPLEWSLSFYSQFKAFDYNTPDYARFVEGHDFNVGDKIVHLEFQNDFVPRRVRELAAAFGARVLFLSFRVTRENPLQTLRVIERFSGVSAFFEEGNFDARKINASGRRNVKFLANLLSRESLIGTIERFGSRRFVQRVRRRFDALGAVPQDRVDAVYTEDEKALNHRLFSGQQQAIDEFFARGPCVAGDGTVFALDQD